MSNVPIGTIHPGAKREIILLVESLVTISASTRKTFDPMKACGPSLRGQTVPGHYFVRRLIPANIASLRSNSLQGIDEIKSKPCEQEARATRRRPGVRAGGDRLQRMYLGGRPVVR